MMSAGQLSRALFSDKMKFSPAVIMNVDGIFIDGSRDEADGSIAHQTMNAEPE